MWWAVARALSCTVSWPGTPPLSSSAWGALAYLSEARLKCPSTGICSLSAQAQLSCPPLPCGPLPTLPSIVVCPLAWALPEGRAAIFELSVLNNTVLTPGEGREGGSSKGLLEPLTLV